jgi:hypothetical protein
VWGTLKVFDILFSLFARECPYFSRNALQLAIFAAGAAQASFAGTAFFFSKEVPANGRRACPAATLMITMGH